MEIRIVAISVSHTDVGQPGIEIDQFVPGIDSHFDVRVPVLKPLEPRD